MKHWNPVPCYTGNGTGSETGVRYRAMFGPDIGVSFWASMRERERERVGEREREREKERDLGMDKTHVPLTN